MAHGLRGIRVEQDSVFPSQASDLRHGMNRADFIVGEHDGDQDGLCADCPAHLVRVHQPVTVHRQVSDPAAGAFQPLASVEHRIVFGGNRDDVIAALMVQLRHSPDGQIVGLGGAGSENDLFGAGADQLSRLFPGQLDRRFRLPSEGVLAAGCVAEFLKEIRRHGLKDPRVHGGRGVMVHIDRQLHPSTCS